jgi:hypothetical protein
MTRRRAIDTEYKGLPALLTVWGGCDDVKPSIDPDHTYNIIAIKPGNDFNG